MCLTMKINADFIERTTALFGKERFDGFMQGLESAPVVSIRYNEAKTDMRPAENPVPWASLGCYLSTRPVFTADPHFHAGCYYVQEASSMFLEQVVRQYVTSPVRALDLCAAPGGKTTNLLSALPQGSMLVSNEPVPLRAQILAENVVKWGRTTSVVTRNEPADFSSFRNFFDIIVVDAPCSGEGMFRKDSFAVEQWSVSNVMQCAKRQRDILSQIWSSLRPGGLLVYSTCTFNREENEDCVEWVANELGATPLPLEIDPAWGITGSLTNAELPVYRFIPGFTAGEGFFLAVLRKDGESDVMQPRVPRVQKLAAKTVSSVEGWLQNPSDFDFVHQGEQIVALPKQHSAAMLALQQKLRVLHLGIVVALVKNNKILPHHSLSMSVELDRTAFPTVDVTREQALSYLHRETLSLPSAPVGFLLLQYEGTPLGFVKNIGNRANNLYPAEWRIRKDPMEL